MLNFRRRLLLILSIPLLLFAVGTVGYMLIEGWGFVDAFYMTTISLTTVGFGEVRPLSALGRMFTVFLLLAGVSTVAYGLTTAVELLVAGDFVKQLRRVRMDREIGRMRSHVIVCGYGRVGKSAAASLKDSKRDVVIIESDVARTEEAMHDGFTIVEGDATRDEVLRDAGIDRAWGVIVTSGNDSVNLFIVLSARSMNADLYIVARSVDVENEPKMRRAGADRVVSPYQIGGKHMANIIVRPHVTDFFDVVTLDGGIELWVEEVGISASSVLVGKTVGDADVRRRTGVTLVALLRHTGGAAVMPDASTRLEAGDNLIVLGTREQLAALEELAET